MYTTDNDGKTYNQCKVLASTLSNIKDLPAECLKHADIAKSLHKQKSTSKDDYAIAFQGMQAGSAMSAMSARSKGQLNNAQIQRRYTNSRIFSTE